MSSAPPLEPALRNRLTRFLHTGSELPKYFPGCWNAHKYFEVDNLKVLHESFEVNKENTEVVNIIVKAYHDGYYTRYDTIAFALAKCLLLGGPLVKEAAYKAVANVCRTSEELMLFAKFTMLMKSGNGQGWCRSIRNWYCSKPPMELAKEVTTVKARHGRSHCTLIRKSHVKIDESDERRNAVIKYAMFGLKQAKQLMANKDTVKEIFEYIQKVEDMRHCEEAHVAAALASQNQFTLHHVPAHLLTSQPVWDAVLPQLSLDELLYNIQRIHNMGFLKSDSTTTGIILSLLNNKQYIYRFKTHPLTVYITLCNYKMSSRPLKYEKAAAAETKKQRRRTRQVFNDETGVYEWAVPKRHPKEIKNWGIDLPPNPAIVKALVKLVDVTWLLMPATGARYMVTLDVRNHMFKGRHFCKSSSSEPVQKKVKKNPEAATGKAAASGGAASNGDVGTAPAVVSGTESANSGGGDAAAVEKKNKKRLLAECFYNKHVTPGHAAIILTLQLLKREKNVTVAVFTDQGVKRVNIDRKINIEAAEALLRKVEGGVVQLDAPIQWASSSKTKVDVFINMIDRTSRYMELPKDQRGGRGPGGRYGAPPQSPDVPDRCPVRALERYRTQQKLPDSKLVVMSLASHRVASTDGSHEGVLDVVGIDEHVPKVLDAFATGQFK